MTACSNKYPKDLKALGGTNKEFPEETQGETLLREIREEGKDSTIEIGRTILIFDRLVSNDHAQYFYLVLDVKNLQGVDEVRYVEEYDSAGVYKETLTVQWVSKAEFEQRMFFKQKEAYRSLLRTAEMKALLKG